MIAYLKGNVRDRKPESVILDVYGVGYFLLIPLSTFYALAPESGEQALRVHTHVREDQITLFGFGTETELELFRALISVPGLGPKTALAALSGMDAETLVQCVATGDVRRLCKIPGIGKKTAERLVVELKDKVAKLVGLPSAAAAAAPAPPTPLTDDLVSAMVNLGYPRADAEKAVDAVLAEGPGAPFETLLKATLRRLMTK